MPTVFVVDGGAVRGVSLLQAVRDAGIHMLPMADAEMALAVLNAIRADLLLIDLSSADTGGIRLIDAVRRNDQLRRMPILAVGARLSGDELRRIQRCIGLGDVIAEGAFSRDELVNQIRRYLARPFDAAMDSRAVQLTN